MGLVNFDPGPECARLEVAMRVGDYSDRAGRVRRRRSVAVEQDGEFGAVGNAEFADDVFNVRLYC